jgi:hypothetical protein
VVIPILRVRRLDLLLRAQVRRRRGMYAKVRINQRICIQLRGRSREADIRDLQIAKVG